LLAAPRSQWFRRYGLSAQPGVLVPNTSALTDKQAAKDNRPLIFVSMFHSPFSFAALRLSTA
jgi:hypothetical protein